MFGELPEIDTNTPGVKVRGFPVHIEASPVGPKLALLRLPTADEEVKYFSAQRTIYRDLGRGMGEWEDTPTPKADLTLFRALRVNTHNGRESDEPSEAGDFDEAEAKYALSLLFRCLVTSCEREGDSYTVALRTMFGSTTHTLRLPYHSERLEYSNTVIRSRDMPHNITERRMPIEAPVKLYDRIVRAVDGYFSKKCADARGGPDSVLIGSASDLHGRIGRADPEIEVVPPHHKRAVVYALMSDLALLDPGLDPNS